MNLSKKVKLAFVEDDPILKKRMVVLKKFKELMKLAGIKSCAVLYWPSKEGTQKVVQNCPGFQRKKRMMVEERRLTRENRKIREEIWNMMFQGRNGDQMDKQSFIEMDIQELCLLADKYLSESPSFLLPFPHDVADVVAPNEFDDHKELVQINCQALYDFYDGLPERINAFIMKCNEISDQSVNENVGLSSDQDPNPDEIQSKKQRGSLEGSHKQASTSTPVITGHMSSSTITTVAAADVTTGDMSSIITTAAAEDGCAPNMVHQ